MWAVGESCPEFSLRTAGSRIGSADLRHGWIALVRCGLPCMAGCVRCLQRFDALGERLAERDCRLLLGVSEPDAAIREILGSEHFGRLSRVSLGLWESSVPVPDSTTLFAVIDPDGIVRSVHWTDTTAPLPEGAILEAVDRAQGLAPRPGVARPAQPGKRADAAACVAWHDHSTDHRLPRSGP